MGMLLNRDRKHDGTKPSDKPKPTEKEKIKPPKK